MKVVIKLFGKRRAFIAIAALFSSPFIVAQQPLASVMNVDNSEIYSADIQGAGMCNIFHEACNSGNSFYVNNTSATEDVGDVLQFSLSCFGFSGTGAKASELVKSRRYANPLWLMQEKNLLKQLFC